MKNTTLGSIVLALASAAYAGEAAPNSINHTVKRGETLFSIAETYYGNGYEWVKLKEYNPWVDEDNPPVGEILTVVEPKAFPGSAAPAAAGQTNLNPGSPRALFAWIPDLGGFSFFGRNVFQLVLLLTLWFVVHCAAQGFIIWFAAHLTFVKDVSMKKAMKATVQSESLAFLCLFMFFLMGLTLLYVGTTSPGKPLGPEILGTAEQYLRTIPGMALSAIFMVGLYVFLGIRFIPQAFGIQTGRAFALVFLGILLPHFVGLFLVGHRMGLIN